jgi:hypothetical protein
LDKKLDQVNLIFKYAFSSSEETINLFSSACSYKTHNFFCSGWDFQLSFLVEIFNFTIRDGIRIRKRIGSKRAKMTHNFLLCWMLSFEAEGFFCTIAWT